MLIKEPILVKVFNRGKYGSGLFFKILIQFILTSALQLVTWNVGFSWPLADKQTIVLNKSFDNFPIFNQNQNGLLAITNSSPKNQCLKHGFDSIEFDLIFSTIRINNIVRNIVQLETSRDKALSVTCQGHKQIFRALNKFCEILKKD